MVEELKDYISNFIYPEYMFTPLTLDLWYNRKQDWQFSIYIFGFRLFHIRRW